MSLPHTYRQSLRYTASMFFYIHMLLIFLLPSFYDLATCNDIWDSELFIINNNTKGLFICL